MLQRLRLQVEQARASLFFVPAVFVLLAVSAGIAMLRVDGYLSARDIRLPAFLESTPESARSLLSTIASATITRGGRHLRDHPGLDPACVKPVLAARHPGFSAGVEAATRDGARGWHLHLLIDASVGGALVLGASRIMLRDVAFGIRQLVAAAAVSEPPDRVGVREAERGQQAGGERRHGREGRGQCEQRGIDADLYVEIAERAGGQWMPASQSGPSSTAPSSSPRNQGAR